MLGKSSEEVEDLQDAAQDEQSVDVNEWSTAQELEGKPGRDSEKQGLPNTVLDVDKPDVDLGNMVFDALNNNNAFFTPEVMMEKFVKDYRNAEKLYGERLIRQMTGLPPEYVEKNMKIPEFKRHLEDSMKQNFERLVDEGVVEKDGSWSESSIELATISLALQELDHLSAKGMIGKKVHRKAAVDGSQEETKKFHKDPYRLINTQQSVKVALRRGHSTLSVEDLRVQEQEAKGSAEIVYAVDASGSMKGVKIGQAKRAGVALAYQAIKQNDKVGLLLFGQQVDVEIPPGKDFEGILRSLVRMKTGSETDLANVIRHSIEMFSSKDHQHLILLTDALPTVGEEPEKDVLSAVSEAAAAQVSISVIGIGLDQAGEELARNIVELGNGRLSIVQDIKELDTIILAEYDAIVG